MKRKRLPLFETLLMAVSAVLLVLMLFGCISLRQAEDKRRELESAIVQQREENRLLLAKCRNILSLEELERYAVEELGMQLPRPWQIVYSELWQGNEE